MKVIRKYLNENHGIRSGVIGGGIGAIIGTLLVRGEYGSAAIVGGIGAVAAIMHLYYIWTKETCSKHYFKSCKKYYTCLINASEKLIKIIQQNKQKFKAKGDSEGMERCDKAIIKIRLVIQKRIEKLKKCKD